MLAATVTGFIGYVESAGHVSLLATVVAASVFVLVLDRIDRVSLPSDFGHDYEEAAGNWSDRPRRLSDLPRAQRRRLVVSTTSSALTVVLLVPMLVISLVRGNGAGAVAVVVILAATVGLNLVLWHWVRRPGRRLLAREAIDERMTGRERAVALAVGCATLGALAVPAIVFHLLAGEPALAWVATALVSLGVLAVSLEITRRTTRRAREQSTARSAA
ncbi:hypothetical protein H5V45_02595 [Nocardioides sp. KIGAM211]|uniref:Uncharacterized protein n=1 Tax=Nocardioides luti TaxID=2761101 RepID=A0A7X0V936_9ACTN|nr:hypothetical protein [Nocardioides luti]MBB6626201.1 hypothetical protein [Nocardioides luti]